MIYSFASKIILEVMVCCPAVFSKKLHSFAGSLRGEHAAASLKISYQKHLV